MEQALSPLGLFGLLSGRHTSLARMQKRDVLHRRPVRAYRDKLIYGVFGAPGLLSDGAAGVVEGAGVVADGDGGVGLTG